MHHKNQLSELKIKRLKKWFEKKKTNTYVAKKVKVSTSTVSKYFYSFKITKI